MKPAEAQRGTAIKWRWFIAIAIAATIAAVLGMMIAKGIWRIHELNILTGQERWRTTFGGITVQYLTAKPSRNPVIPSDHGHGWKMGSAHSLVFGRTTYLSGQYGGLSAIWTDLEELCSLCRLNQAETWAVLEQAVAQYESNGTCIPGADVESGVIWCDTDDGRRILWPQVRKDWGKVSVVL